MDTYENRSFTGEEGTEENKRHKSRSARLFDGMRIDTRYWYRGKFTACIVTLYYVDNSRIKCANGMGITARKSTYANNNGDTENEEVRREVSRGRALADLIDYLGGVEKAKELVSQQPEVLNGREQGVVEPSIVEDK
jgi:hypothetical protein